LNFDLRNVGYMSMTGKLNRGEGEATVKRIQNQTSLAMEDPLS